MAGVEVSDHESTVLLWFPEDVGGNVPRERTMCAVSTMRVVRGLGGAGEELGRPMQEMDDMRREGTLLRGWGQVPGWVVRCSILSRGTVRVGVVGKEEGVVPTETLDGRSDVSAAEVQSIGLTGPCLI